MLQHGLILETSYSAKKKKSHFQKTMYYMMPYIRNLEQAKP